MCWDIIGNGHYNTFVAPVIEGDWPRMQQQREHQQGSNHGIKYHSVTHLVLREISSAHQTKLAPRFQTSVYTDMTHTDGHRKHRKSQVVVLGYRFYVYMGSCVGYHDDKTTFQLLRNYNNCGLNLRTQKNGMSVGIGFSIISSQISNFTVMASCPT